MNMRPSKRKQNAARSSMKAWQRRLLEIERLEDRTVLSTFTVTNTQDSATGSLRWAVAQANTNPGADSIVFDRSVFGSPQTIALTSGAITFTDTATTTVTGPGAGLVTVTANQLSNDFVVNAAASANLDTLTITGGRATTGGGVYSQGTLVISNSLITGNTATTGKGGGVDNSSGVLTISNSVLSNNSAYLNGGGVDSLGDITLTNCTITGNSQTGSGGSGGGVGQYDGNVTISGCTISGNTATSQGGLELDTAGQSATISNTTISNNTSTGSIGGIGLYYGLYTLTQCTITGNTAAGSTGGVYFRSNYNSTITDCTIIGNSASSAGGLYSQMGSPKPKNSIIAGNTAATSPDVQGPVTSLGTNLIGKTDGSSGWIGSDLQGTVAAPLNALLSPLGNFGGTTQTMLPQSGSPAIGAGDNTGGPATDQRGFTRSTGTGGNIGATEGTALVVTTTADSGAGSLRTAVASANAAATADAIIFDPTQFGTPRVITLTTGQLTLSDAKTTTITGPGASLLTISGNNTSRIFNVPAGASAAMSGLTLTGGKVAAGNGGAIFSQGLLALTNCTVTGNSALTGLGGGIYNFGGRLNGGGLTLTGCTISSNSANSGGGVGTTGYPTTTMINSIVTGNTSTFQGGGFYGGGNTRNTLTNTIFSNNRAGDGGGGIFLIANAVVTNCTVTGNFAQIGAGVYLLSVTNGKIVGSNISGNTVTVGASGGGIAIQFGSITVANTTISGNSAFGGGGVVTISAPSTLTLTNSTIAGNSATGGTGGGILNAGTVTLNNTIVATNTSNAGASDISGTVSGSNNLIGTGGAGGLVNLVGGNLVGVANPGLMPLGNYGGPVQTMALLPTSPAINAGNDTLAIDPITSQILGGDARGASRFNSGPVDIGAFEIQVYLVTTTSDVMTDGQTTLRQAIIGASLFSDSVVRFAISGAGPFVITPSSALPSIGSSVLLDGTSQLGYAGTPLIQLAGSAGAGDGITLGTGSDGSTVQGFDIGGFTAGAGIRILSNRNLIRGNYLGTNVTGTAANGDKYGIAIQGSQNTIGGLTALSRNVISGNLQGGIAIATGSSNVVQGNFIGLNAAGNAAIGNTQFGIQIANAANTTIGGTASGSGNRIAATQVLGSNPGSGWGIDVAGVGSSGSVIQGNTIGGSGTFGNASAGIFDDLAPITIGGTIAGQGNAIAFNGGAGISLTSVGAANSRVRQNSINANTGGGVIVGAPTAAYQPPVISTASIVGNTLKVQGVAYPGALLEFYIASSGQGSVFLGSAAEGSLADNNATSGTFNFALTIPNGVSVTAGNPITAITVATPISGSNPPLKDTVSPFATAVVSDSGPAFGGPVVNAGGGGTIVAGSTFTSQGSFTDTTSQSWTATVNYGDGSATQSLRINPVSLTGLNADQYSQVASASFNLSHQFAKAGNYTVVVSVTNDAGLTGTSSFVVQVAAAAPVVNNTDIHIAPTANPTNTSSPTIINENQSVILTGKFTDANPGATHSVNIIWGDGSTSLATVNEASSTFTATHTYLSPGTINSSSGIYTVQVAVNSSVGTTSSTTYGLFYIQVNDVAPSNLTVTPDASTIAEGGIIHLSGSFQATGPIDTHVVTIDWGDQSTVTTFDLAGGVLSFSGIAHQYRSYAPGAAGTPYAIQVSVNDLYQPLSPAKATTSVIVNATAPSNIVLTPSAGTINQGQSIALAGSFAAPGTLDHHVVSINWGDGSKLTTVSLAPGVTTFSGITHNYATNSLLVAGGGYTITATITDPARPAAVGTATTSVIVRDIAPTVSNLALAYATGGAVPVLPQTGGGSALQVNAGSSVTLTGSFTTPNPKDKYSLLVSWGDGTSSTVPTSYLSSHTFTATHLYSDRALGVTLNNIHVSITDLENTSGSSNLTLAVAHVNPVAHVGSGGINSGNQVLTAAVAAGNTSPIASYSWNVTALNGSYSLTTSSPTVALPTNTNTDYLVQSSVTDTLGATSQTFTAVVHVLDNTSSNFVVPQPTANVDAVVVSGLSGNHVIDGTGVSVPIVFDGNGQETFIGNSSDDVFNLHTDNSIAYGNGGNNVFNLTPNCTLYAVATGGNNTLNFSSSTYGVTFDMNKTSGQVQDVNPVADPGNHFVSVNATGGATFSTLVNSAAGGDTITAASNSTIIGSGGKNSVLVNSTAASPVNNVSIVSAADGDTLTLSGASIGNISFQGDTGANLLTNTGTITGNVVFSGGADTSTFTNSGSIAGSVSFGGGADGGSFTNTGSVTGTLTFGGGADTNTLVNSAGATLGTVIFNGDVGATTFTNSGYASSIVYNGGSDTDSFTNTSGGVVGSLIFNGSADTDTLTNAGTAGSITYNGGADAGSLTNSGTVTGSITFNGGADAGTLLNTGTVSGTVTFGGGSDTDTFTNAVGGSVASVVFTGGADSGTLINNGTVTGSVSFGGGSDAGTITNNGTITGTVSFGGGADSNTFTNATGASVGSVIYTGGADAGTVLNFGAVTGSINFAGGSDAGSLLNTGTVAGSIVYTGGADTDSLVNQGAVYGGISFSGGADANSFTNTGSVTGTVTYTGGADTDSFTNNGTLSNVIFSGGADANTFTNNGTFGSITYTGGSDSDTLINTATGSAGGAIIFNGDAGVDQLINLGTLSSVTYTGGSDSDTLLNPGTISGSVVFNGDSGADLFQNGANVNGVFVAGTVGSITYNAGSDTDTLLNPGIVTGAIIFNGDASAPAGTVMGAKQVINTGRAGSIVFNGALTANGTNDFSADAGAETLANYGSVGSIVFNGDGNSDLLINQASGVGSIVFNGGGDTNVLINTGSNFGTISFQGDGGVDTFINTANGSSSSHLIFNGGGDTGTLLNTGSGIGVINFTGDTGSNTLINEGSRIGQITFGAGADGGAFLNAGNNVSTITFNGGADTNVFRNDGSQVGTINFNGDVGSGYFLNNGSVATINYNAGSDTDTLVNNGTVGSASGTDTVGGINFAGDGSADGLLNTSTGTINGLIFTSGADANLLVNQGTITNATANFQGDDGVNQFVNQAGGTVSNITYNGGSDTDTFTNYGNLSNVTYNGDTGYGSMYLHGTLNQNITYNAGADGDQLIIGPDATAVSTINFNGDGGTDLLANAANGATNITFQAGSDAANFWNFGNNVSNLTFLGGGADASFSNSGSGVTGIVFNARGDTGADSLYNSGDNVGTISFTGGADTNTLVNTGANTASILFNAGSDTNTFTNTGSGVVSIIFNGDTGVDSLINSGNSVGTILFNGGSDADSLVNTGSAGTINFQGDGAAATFTNSGPVNTLIFNGGADSASFLYSATGPAGSTVTFTGHGGGNIFVDSGSAGSMTISLGTGDNQAVIMTGATGNVAITGGAGNNTYIFSGTPTANVSLNQPLFATTGTMTSSGNGLAFVANPTNPAGFAEGTNTLDFSAYTGGGISLDLMNTSAQTMTGGMKLTLSDPEGIANVVGTQFGDQISGNMRPNVISTANLPDYRLAGQTGGATSTPFAPDARTQWVYLDFDTYTVAGDHVYTAAERTAILTRIELDYYGPDPTNPSVPNFANRWFDVALTNNRSDIPANLLTAGQYATLYFNRTPPSGLPGGEASEVDFGNTNFGGYASIQINGMVDGGGQPASIDPVTGADNFAILSGKIGAHELAHLLGVRHSDAFGPIGFGIHTPPGTSMFNPTYEGAAGAFETFDHLISSPATVGSDRFNDLRALDFGPREAIKLAFASRGTTLVASAGTHSSTASAQSLALAPLSVPNTDVNLAELEKGMNFQVAALDVQGTIGLDPTTHRAAPDYYTISGQKGDIYTFEVDSQELARLGGINTIDSVLTVYDANGNVVAFNDDQYEGTDSLLLDVTLPSTGTYYVKVASFAASADAPAYDPTNPTSPLNPSNLDSILNPLNPNFSQDALNSFLAAKNGTATGQYDLFMYRFSQADPTVADVHNVLVARGAGSTLMGSTGTDTLMGPAGTIMSDTSTGPGSQVTLTVSNSNPSVDVLSHFQDTVTLVGQTGSTPWNVTIDYGDNSAAIVTQVAAGSTIGLDHLYQAAGNYTVSVQVQTGAGTFQTTVPASISLAQAPAPTITAISAGRQNVIGSPVSLGGSLQSPYANVNYTVTWTFTNIANSADVLTTSKTISTNTAGAAIPFTASQIFTNAATYAVTLTILDLANGKSTTVQSFGGNPAQVTIYQFITTNTTATAPNATYNGHAYAAATASVVGIDQSVPNAPALTFRYYASTDTALTNPLPAAPTSAGRYLAVATFAGDSIYSGSTSVPVVFTIAQAPLTVTIADSSKPYGTNNSAALTGTISGIQNNDTITASYSSTGSSGTADVGAYAITASVSGATATLANYAITYKNAAGTKTTGTLTVSPDHTTTTVSSVSGTAFWGSPVTFTATVANLDSAIAPLGTVEFFDGAVDLGPGVLAAPTGNQSRWSLTTSTLAPGSHGVTAVYTPATLAGSSDFLTSNSQNAPFAELIRGGSTTTTGAASLTTAFYGQTEIFTATVLVNGTPAVGTVDFFDNTTGVDLGIATLNANGVATLTPNVPLPAGTQSITMSFAAGNGYTASSATLSVVVQPSIYILNSTASGSLTLSGSSTITVPGLVQVNSSSATAIQESGATRTSASAIRVVGGSSATGSSSFSTTPVKNVASVADPLLSLPIPAAAGLQSFAAINLGANNSLTINPGIYPAINVTASAHLTMNPGIYVITGGGFSVNGAATVNGSGVMIYNAGSNYNGGTGSTYGGVTLGGSGAVNLSAPTSGVYAGVLLFQSRDNTRAISLSGAAVAALNGGVIYASAALASVSGSAQLGAANQAASSLLVNQLQLTGSGTSNLTAAGVTDDAPDVAGQLIAGDLSIYVDNSSGMFTSADLARIADAVNSASATVAPYGVQIVELSDPTYANTIIRVSSTSPAGSANDGVLGCETPGAITLLSGWNWYSASDPTQIGQNQYDLETIVLHEIGHVLGLGHSPDATSVMFASLETGHAKRSLSDADLAIPDAETGPCGLHAATDAGLEFASTSEDTASDLALQNLAEEVSALPPSSQTVPNKPIVLKADSVARPQRTTARPRQVSIATPTSRSTFGREGVTVRFGDDLLETIAEELATKKTRDMTG